MIANIDLKTSVKEVMMKSPICVQANTLMTEIEKIFAENTFHHIPVLDENRRPVGIISKSDFYKLQHHFTLFEFKDAEDCNERFFKSLIASDVMNKQPISVGSSTEIKDVLKMLMENTFHSLLVVEDEQCVGIVTPHDFLELLLNQ